jgi:hypothetical protein
MKHSQNIVDYIIKDRDGRIVGFHRHLLHGKSHWGDLLDFTPSLYYTIKATGYNDENEPWQGNPMRLDRFLNNLVDLKSTFDTVEDWLKKKK